MRTPPLHGQIYWQTRRADKAFHARCYLRILPIGIDEGDCDMTMFTSHHGLCRFLRMPFRLKKAPSDISERNGHYPLFVRCQFVLVYPFT